VQPAQTFRIIPFVTGLLICSFACNASADTPQIRLSIQAFDDTGDNAPMLSALSHEFRKLDGVSITDKQPALKINCYVIKDSISDGSGRHMFTGYSVAIAVTDADNHLLTFGAQTGATIDQVAHNIAVSLDGKLIESMRRSAQPSSSP
jgi:hypothetical protein